MRSAAAHTYQTPEQAALGVRVDTLEAGLTNLESSMRAGFAHIETTIGGLASQFQASRAPNWQALAAWASVIILIGAAMYAPILKSTNTLETAVETRVTEKAFDVYAAAIKERMGYFSTHLAKLDDEMVRRAEHQVHWQMEAAEVADIRRELDTLRRQYGETYNARDVIRRLESHLDDLERTPRRPPPPQ